MICLSSMVAMASCSDNVEEVVEPVPYKSDLSKGVQLTFLAVSPNGGANTRTHLEYKNAEYFVYWDFEDDITVFSGGEGFYFNTYGSGSTVSFSGTVTKEDEKYYALYPYDYESTIVFDGDDATITTTLPAVQDATQDSFMRDANITVAHTVHEETMTFGFRNVCGLIKFTIDSSSDVLPITSAVLEGNNSEKLAGKLEITDIVATPSALAEPEGTILAGGSSTSITLVAPLDETLEKATYYFVVPPINFENGYKITFYGGESPLVWNHTAATVQRSRILDAGTYTYVAPVAPTP